MVCLRYSTSWSNYIKRGNVRRDIIVQSVVGEVGEAGTKRACEIGPKGDLALVLDTSENQALGQGGVITGWITVKSKNTIHDGARSRKTIHAGGDLFASAIEK